MKPKIYLAGPDVFREFAVEHGKELKQLCEKYGAIGLFPFDNEVNPPDSRLIFEANFKMIQECDAVVANVSPFRGPSVDPGTAWELGAAYALGKVITAYSDDLSDYKDRAKLYNKEPYINIEDFGWHDNLMIAECASATAYRVEMAIKLAVKLCQT